MTSGLQNRPCRAPTPVAWVRFLPRLLFYEQKYYKKKLLFIFISINIHIIFSIYPLTPMNKIILEYPSSLINKILYRLIPNNSIKKIHNYLKSFSDISYFCIEKLFASKHKVTIHYQITNGITYNYHEIKSYIEKHFHKYNIIAIIHDDLQGISLKKEFVVDFNNMSFKLQKNKFNEFIQKCKISQTQIQNM